MTKKARMAIRACRGTVGDEKEGGIGESRLLKES